jgi:hypothetical protein
MCYIYNIFKKLYKNIKIKEELIMKYLVLIVLLSAAVANASSTGGTGGATGGATGGPNSEWARAPHAEPARLHNGRIVLDGAASGSASGSTGASGATGLQEMPRRPSGIVAPCADCGAKDNKPEETHPVVHSANVVFHPSIKEGGATGSYNATGDYKGQGNPHQGEWTKEHEAGPKCCRVCAPATECKNKNKCFNICKKVCGPTCVIPAPPRCVKPPCKKEEKKEEAKPWVSPEITDEMKTKVHAADPKDKVKTIMGLLRGQK